MKIYFKITLITFIILVIALAGLLFTQQGNDYAKPFLKAELEKQVGLPVEVDIFKLRYNHTALKIIINDALTIDVKSVFSLLGMTCDGTYSIHANNFVHNEINLKQANINGEFEGEHDNIYVNGKGNTFNAPITYYLRIIDGDAKRITVQLKDMKLSDILEFAKQPAMAKGKVDANLTIPTLITGEINTHGIISLSNITFDDALMKKHYKVSMPKALQVDGIIDANLTDTQIIGGADIHSELANVTLKNLHFNKETKHISSQYIVDILNLNAFSDLLHTKLDGVILLEGEVEKKEKLKVTGLTKSLGGEINYQLINNNFTSSIDSVPVKNMLHMFRFPAFVDANASGKLRYDTKEKKGETQLTLRDFKPASNKVTKSMKMMVLKDPSSIVFGQSSLDAKIDGDQIHYTLIAKAHDASITVDEAIINKKEDSHNAKIAFAYEKFEIQGNVDGSIRSPRIDFNIKALQDLDFMATLEREIKRILEQLNIS
jgi:hypothetical protein